MLLLHKLSINVSISDASFTLRWKKNCWKRARDDIFTVWPHSIDELDIFFDYMNKVDPTEKTQFTMKVSRDN